jgi:hypothetical protein
MKDKGTASSTHAPPARQSDEASTTMDRGAADPLVASVFHIQEIPSWAEPFSSYLITGDLPQDEAEARRIQHRAGAYTIINSELYKRSMSGIFQKCIEPEEGIELLREIHQGECFGGQSLPPWFLLANGQAECRAAGEIVQRLPALLQAQKHSSGSPQDHPAHLAVHSLGAWTW